MAYRVRLRMALDFLSSASIAKLITKGASE